MSSCYASYDKFGASTPLPSSNPLSICAVSGLDAGFQNVIGTRLLNPKNEQCQRFLPAHCAATWDGVCEALSYDTNRNYPNMLNNCNGPNGSCMGPGLGSALTFGEMLIRNTAAEKYLKAMSSNCHREYEPFDPTNPNSPLISRWVTGNSNDLSCTARGTCIPIYGVDSKTIDSDIVMDKILQNPFIAIDILMNIYTHAVQDGTIKQLQGTKLYNYFMSPQFQQIFKERVIKYVQYD